MNRNWIVGLAAIAAVSTALLLPWSRADEGTKGKAGEPDKTEGATEENPLEESLEGDRLEEMKDSGFTRFIDLEQLAGAWLGSDAGLLTDIALQFAEGERVLRRGHKSGITSAKLFTLAAKVAIDQRDKTAFDRLKAVSEGRKDAALTAMLNGAAKTMATARSISPASKLSVEELTPEQFEKVKALSEDINRLGLAGDTAGLKATQADLEGNTDLADAQRAYLAGLAKKALEDAPEDSDATAESLRKLAGGARGTMSNRDQVRAGVHGGGWEIVWGVEINEGEYAKLLLAIGQAIVVKTPAPVIQYFKDYLVRTYNKVKKSLPGVAQTAFVNAAMRAIKDRGQQRLGRLGIKGGIATYRCWQEVVYNEPRTRTAYKTIGPSWARKKIPYPEVYTVQVKKTIPLPNKHQPYFGIRLY